jgi:hypothetical protein
MRQWLIDMSAKYFNQRERISNNYIKYEYFKIYKVTCCKRKFLIFIVHSYFVRLCI